MKDGNITINELVKIFTNLQEAGYGEDFVMFQSSTNYFRKIASKNDFVVIKDVFSQPDNSLSDNPPF